MSTIIPGLYPLNDLYFLVTLSQVSSTTGEVSALTTGSPTCFLATSNSPTATAADATLAGTITHVGTAAAGNQGTWLVSFDAAALTAALLATHFATVTPYCIINLTGGIRVYVELAYSASRTATVTR